MNAASKHFGLPFSLGDSFTPEQVREYFHGGGMWTEVNASGHGAFAFIVTRMEEDEHSPVEEGRAAYMIMACNSHDMLIAAMKQMRVDALSNEHGYIVDQIDAALATAGVKP
jgi:hypothetical protein